MREVDDAHDAEDHRQAERHQPVDHAGQQALGDGLREVEEEVGGHQSPLPRSGEVARRAGGVMATQTCHRVGLMTPHARFAGTSPSRSPAKGRRRLH